MQDYSRCCTPHPFATFGLPETRTKGTFTKNGPCKHSYTWFAMDWLSSISLAQCEQKGYHFKPDQVILNLPRGVEEHSNHRSSLRKPYMYIY